MDSLNVLYLFFEALDRNLHIDHKGADDEVAGLRTEGIHFAEQLLRNEFEFLADGTICLKQLFGSMKVGPEPGYFLAYVKPLCKKGYFSL